MELRQLEYFVRVAEVGSFTRASEMLNVAQPALSRQVRLLEVELRQTLLIRNGRGATPTEAGQVLLEHARGILHQVARTREELGRVRGALAGRVALGLPPTLTRVLAVPLTRAFQSQLPKVHLSIGEGLSTVMREGLIQGRLDLAVLYNAQPGPELELQHLLEEELVLVQQRPSGLAEDPPPDPITLREVAHLPLVIPSRPNAIRMQVESAMTLLGCRPRIALEMDGVAAILELVADGAGCALLSRHAVTHYINPSALSVRRVCQPQLLTHLVLASSALRPATLTQQAAQRLMQHVVVQHMRHGSHSS